MCSFINKFKLNLMMDLEQKIIQLCKHRYGQNLAGILIFGSYNTGTFVQGKSDIDTLIFLKSKKGLQFQDEGKIIMTQGKEIQLSVQGVGSLRIVKNRLYKEGGWSTWITILVGSKKIYTTSSFDKFVNALADNELPLDKVINYLISKDHFELEGYFKNLDNWGITKGLFSHMRRKLQILNYYQGNSLEFDYNTCLGNIKGIQKERLQVLSQLYQDRENIPKEDLNKYITLARKLTPLIVEQLNRKRLT